MAGVFLTLILTGSHAQAAGVQEHKTDDRKVRVGYYYSALFQEAGMPTRICARSQIIRTGNMSMSMESAKIFWSSWSRERSMLWPECP